MPQVRRIIARYTLSKLLRELERKIELANDNDNPNILIRYKDDFFGSLVGVFEDTDYPRRTFDDIEDVISNIDDEDVGVDYLTALQGAFEQAFGGRY
jgi:hypothetical protein